MSGVPVRGDDAIGSLEIYSLQARYRSGELDPVAVIDAIFDRIESNGNDAVWISRVPRERARAAARAARADLPLYGIPFAVKDNIDAVALPTTAACPEFEYQPQADSTVVARLIAAGAILIGKTNLDQFATGLNGTRSPYGSPATPFDPAMISGGSSSGSAVAVSAGLVSFALGTDTAGSGRVPAAFTSTVGFKPSRGLVSNSGVVPACRSLDCVSVSSLTVADGALVLAQVAGVDSDDPWSRAMEVPPAVPGAVRLASLTLGIPATRDLGFDSGSPYEAAWNTLLDSLAKAGVRTSEIDMGPFLEAGELLYNGPWLAERLSGVEDFVTEHPEAVHPVILELLESGRTVSGADAFRGLDHIHRLRAAVAPVFETVDCVLTPTAVRTFAVEEMLTDPIGSNSALGRFTTFGNLLDLAAVAVPAGMTDAGMPFGVSLVGAAGSDARLASIAAAVEELVDLPLGATGLRRVGRTRGGSIDADGLLLAVVGAHLEGMPLHGQLTSIGAVLATRTTTSPEYLLYALADTVPAKPGLVRVGAGGSAIELEVYRVPRSRIGDFLAGVGAPLAIGTVRLSDGSAVHGFVCEPAAIEGATDITEFGGWRAYQAAGVSRG